MMERVGSKVVYEGQIATVRVDTFRSADGSEYEREIVGHPGAVAVVAHDEERLFLVRQPREAVDEDDLLELPAGKLDVEGATPLECARRELEEEAGVRAAEWREAKSLYTSPGFAEEEVTVFFASGLERVDPSPDEGEHLEIVEWPLADLDGAIDACADAKSLVGLLLFRRSRAG
jgi:8-oxo-dGTP pyrophosphatase MutT (NUDIX family)